MRHSVMARDIRGVITAAPKKKAGVAAGLYGWPVEPGHGGG
jgi:hypothetical protein